LSLFLILANDFIRPIPALEIKAGFFFQDYSTFVPPTGLFDLLWKVIFRLEFTWLLSNRTVWDYTIQPIFIWVSRKVSGLTSKSEPVTNIDEIELHQDILVGARILC
jgi:hypothetical protein